MDSEHPVEETPFHRALTRGETVADANVRIRRPDGTEIAALGSAAPIEAPDGRQLGAVRTLHDVTAQRELERQREEFLANASHDLRTPVATIKASMDVVLRNAPLELDPTLRQLLQNVNRETDRMATLIEDLLELTRLRAGAFLRSSPTLTCVPSPRVRATPSRFWPSSATNAWSCASRDGG